MQVLERGVNSPTLLLKTDLLPSGSSGFATQSDLRLCLFGQVEELPISPSRLSKIDA